MWKCYRAISSLIPDLIFTPTTFTKLQPAQKNLRKSREKNLTFLSWLKIPTLLVTSLCQLKNRNWPCDVYYIYGWLSHSTSGKNDVIWTNSFRKKEISSENFYFFIELWTIRVAEMYSKIPSIKSFNVNYNSCFIKNSSVPFEDSR